MCTVVQYIVLEDGHSIWKTENSSRSKYKMVKDIQMPDRRYDHVAELSS